MAFYSLTLLEMARILATRDDAWTDIELKFIEHFVLIVDAMHSQGLWDEEDGFFYDVLHAPDGTPTPIKVRSMVGVLPLLGTVAAGAGAAGALATLQKRFAGFLGQDDAERPADAGRVFRVPGTTRSLSASSPRREARRVLARVFDEDEFLSPYGLRALSQYHEEHPVSIDLAGSARRRRLRARRVTTGMFGGNSNWRGPVWMPVNYLVAAQPAALRAVARRATAEFEYPTGSGETLAARRVRRRPAAAA